MKAETGSRRYYWRAGVGLTLFVASVFLSDGCEPKPPRCYDSLRANSELLERIGGLSAAAGAVREGVKLKELNDTLSEIVSIEALAKFVLRETASKALMDLIGDPASKLKQAACARIDTCQRLQSAFDTLPSLSKRLNDALASGDVDEIGDVAREAAYHSESLRKFTTAVATIVSATGKDSTKLKGMEATLRHDVEFLARVGSNCRSRCGRAGFEPKSKNLNGVVVPGEDAWSRYECRRGTAVEGCLQRIAYSNVDGTGCHGEELCCPPK